MNLSHEALEIDIGAASGAPRRARAGHGGDGGDQDGLAAVIEYLPSPLLRYKQASLRERWPKYRNIAARESGDGSNDTMCMIKQ